MSDSWEYTYHPGHNLDTLTEADLDACLAALASIEAQLAYARQQQEALASVRGRTVQERLYDSSEA
jgi:hypothetical protein